MNNDAAGASPVDCRVRPRAWQWLNTGILRKKLPLTAEPGAWTPLHDLPPELLDAIGLVLADAMSQYGGSRETPDHAVQVAVWLDSVSGPNVAIEPRR